MNRVPTAPQCQTRPRSADCPPDEQLLELIRNSLSGPQQVSLTAHLDRCDDCRTRLEAIAADGEQWHAIRRNLSASDDEILPSARLTAAIRSLQEPTQMDLTASLSDLDSAAAAQAGEFPRQIGPYEMIELVGQGGMGLVYKAFDASLGRHVAVKVMADSIVAHRDSLQRFRREARSAAAIRDAHVVAIYAIEDTAPRPYLVMELVDGTSLEERLRREGRLAWQEVARIGAEAALGLAAAHAAGLIHRDIKPANLLIEQRTGCVKISDFGLARAVEDSSLTQTGCVRGTPEYISPEQAAGERVDHRADLFSLGSVLYAACTGTPPFRAENPLVVLRRTREDLPTPIDQVRDDVPAALIGVINRLMSKDPEQRFASAADVAACLQRIRQGEHAASAGAAVIPRPARGQRSTRKLVAVAAGLLLAIGGAAGIYGIASSILASGETVSAPARADSEQAGRPPVAPGSATDVGEDAGSPESAVALAIDDEERQPEATPVPQPAAGDAVKTTGMSMPPPPSRVQMVTPDALMRERIQAEKDLLELPRHPLLVREFPGHTGPVNSLAFTPDGACLVTVSGWPTGDRTARVWDLATGREIRRFDTAAMPKNPGTSGGREAPGELFTVAITPDGKHAVTGATGGAVCVWEIASGNLVRQFDKHTATVYDAAISPRGDLAVTGGRDKIGRLWDLANGEERMQLSGHRSWIRAVAFSPDGKRVLTGGYDKVMRLWDIERGEMIREFGGQQNWIWDIAFAPSGRMAASVSGARIQLWDLESGELLRSLSCPDAGDATSVDISPDGRLVISGGYDGNVRLWDADTGELLETYTGHRDWVWSVKFSPDGRQFASAGGGRYTATGGTEAGIDFALRLWKLPPTGPRVVKPK